MIRGFEYGGIGPVDARRSNDQLGGTTYFNASAEAQFPVPVIPESFGLRARFSPMQRRSTATISSTTFRE